MLWTQLKSSHCCLHHGNMFASAQLYYNTNSEFCNTIINLVGEQLCSLHGNGYRSMTNEVTGEYAHYKACCIGACW